MLMVQAENLENHVSVSSLVYFPDIDKRVKHEEPVSCVGEKILGLGGRGGGGGGLKCTTQH